MGGSAPSDEGEYADESLEESTGISSLSREARFDEPASPEPATLPPPAPAQASEGRVARAVAPSPSPAGPAPGYGRPPQITIKSEAAPRVVSPHVAPQSMAQPKRTRSFWLIALVIALIFVGLAVAATLAWLIFR